MLIKRVSFFVTIFISLNTFGQINDSKLQLFVNENKSEVETQIKHIKKIICDFQQNRDLYPNFLSVNSLSNRENNYLVDVSKINIIGYETQLDWINIMALDKDTFCCSLDYFEYYWINPSSRTAVIKSVQGDYPDGFLSEEINYYFSNDSLLFVFVKREEFPPMRDNYFISENRFYYSNNKPIRCLKKESNDGVSEISSLPNEFIELNSGIEYFETGVELLNKFKRVKIIQ